MTCWTLVTQGTLGPVHPKNSSNCCRSTQGLVKAGTAKKFFKQALADAQSAETVLAKKFLAPSGGKPTTFLNQKEEQT
jgi:hypothetical protein